MHGHSHHNCFFACLMLFMLERVKCGLTNWMILLLNERACWSILHTIRDGDQTLKIFLPRDSVLKKKQNGGQLYSSFLNRKIAEPLGTNHVVHAVVPDTYKISSTNKIGLYRHSIAICNGDHGRCLVLDYASTKNPC